MFKTVIDTRSVWLVVALGAYWAWGLASLHDTLGMIANTPGIWTTNAGAHAAVLLGIALVSLRLRTLRVPGLAVGVAGFLATASLPLELLAGFVPGPLATYCGPVLAGGASAVLALALFPQLARIVQPGELFVLVAAAVAASPLISLVILALPHPLDLAALTALPALAAFCLLRGYVDAAPANPHPHRASDHPTPMVTVPLVLCSFIFAFCTSLFNGNASPVTGAVDLPAVLSLTFLVMIVVLVLVGLRGSARWPVVLVLVFMPTLAAGVLLAPFLISESLFVTNALMDIAHNLFTVYLYTSLAVIIAKQGRPLFATGMVVGIGDLGHVMGSLLERAFITATDHQVLLGCVVIAYLVFLCALLLMYPRGSQTALSFMLQAAPLASGEPPAPQTPLHRAAQAAGLSEREEEVLAQLVGSRTLASIADELGVSYNTAKTHTRRIFHKTGVSSRSELAAWVEGFSAES